MKRTITFTALSLTTAFSLTILPASALPTAARGAAATANSTADQTKVQLIINRGNNEISRRIASLQKLISKINTASRLTASDKAALSAEVNNEIDGLNSLKTKLDADTTVADARTDAQSIITGYRVYALIMPKVNLIRVADDQQAAETKLTDLAPKLQSRIDSAKAAGKNVTSLQSGLDDLNAKVSAAQAISSSVESSLLPLQPSDYNSDHSVLSGYRDKLKTAQTDVRAAVNDANSIVSALKNL